MRLSIVIPVFNEAPILKLLLARLDQALEGIDWEAIFVNDGSTDDSLAILRAAARKNRHVKVLSFPRNFGHQAAITAGLDFAEGDAVAVMDADLQDPPELLAPMLELLRDGYDVISPHRVVRAGETRFKRCTAALFYRLMMCMGDRRLSSEVGDFRLFSRRAVIALRAFREQHRFMRGLVSWLGLKEAALPFERPPRADGVTKYSPLKMARLAWTAITSFSAFPVRLAAAAGAALSGTGLVCLSFVLYRAFQTRTVAGGWAVAAALQCIFSGLILVALGVIGDYLAIRGSGAVNGVSRLHGEVSRRIFQPLFPRWPVREVPVGHVTNGVHTASWDSPEADELWTSVCGKGHWLGTDLKVIEEKMRGVPDAVLWNMRQRARRSMISYLRRRLARQLAGHGALKQEIEQARGVLDPDALTMGFARRFASYKRPNLLLHDRDRLLRILTNTVRPVQLVIAGKAHPHDAGGQEMIRQWVEFIRHTSARSQAVFLSDDDMGLTEHLVQGIDLWLNTPQRPWEASGTSGMKVLVNGGLNFSELDGWWAEAYSPEVGWALGDGCEHAEDAAWDAHEADQLYTLLEREIVPEFYDRDEPGIPAGWIAKMRESMARLTPQFSAIRQMREYTEQHYLPLAHHFLRRSRDDGRAGAGIVEWQRQVEQHWSRLRFGSLKVSTDAGRHTFAVQVWLNELASDAVTVELFAEGLSDKAPVRCSMTQGKALVGSENGHTWTATVPADRPAEDFTPRLLPRHEGAMVPLECPRILWYR